MQGSKSGSGRRWCAWRSFLIAITTIWLYLVYQQHDTLVRNSSYSSTTALKNQFLLQESSSTTLPVTAKNPERRESATSYRRDEKGERRQQSYDAVFNSIPVRLIREAPPITRHRCVGPTLRQFNKQLDGEDDSSKDEDWMYRSCEYTNLCLDPATGEYLSMHDTAATTTPSIPHTLVPPVALGPINPRWMINETQAERNATKVQWSPTRALSSSFDSYYRMLNDDRYVLAPFHSMAAHNVGHLLWDDFYALYVLLVQFGYDRQMILETNAEQHPQRQLLPMRVQLNNGTALWASCDMRRNKRMACKANLNRFLPLLGVPPETVSASRRIDFQEITNGAGAGGMAEGGRRLVCAKTAVAGTGLLQDHGWSDHGWDGSDGVPHNLGRGRLFSDFRQFLLHHHAFQTQQPPQQSSKEELSPGKMRQARISFSVRSSRDWIRKQDFTSQITALRERKIDATIQSYNLAELSLSEQITMATKTDIFVTTCGGGSMTATFLPRDATLIVFYDVDSGLDARTDRIRHVPARLDWDLLNHASHLKVHWLPIQTMEEDLDIFGMLVEHELAVIAR